MLVAIVGLWRTYIISFNSDSWIMYDMPITWEFTVMLILKLWKYKILIEENGSFSSHGSFCGCHQGWKEELISF